LNKNSFKPDDAKARSSIWSHIIDVPVVTSYKLNIGGKDEFSDNIPLSNKVEFPRYSVNISPRQVSKGSLCMWKVDHGVEKEFELKECDLELASTLILVNRNARIQQAERYKWEDKKKKTKW